LILILSPQAQKDDTCTLVPYPSPVEYTTTSRLTSTHEHPPGRTGSTTQSA